MAYCCTNDITIVCFLLVFTSHYKSLFVQFLLKIISDKPVLLVKTDPVIVCLHLMDFVGHSLQFTKDQNMQQDLLYNYKYDGGCDRQEEVSSSDDSSEERLLKNWLTQTITRSFSLIRQLKKQIWGEKTSTIQKK